MVFTGMALLRGHGPERIAPAWVVVPSDERGDPGQVGLFEGLKAVDRIMKIMCGPPKQGLIVRVVIRYS